MLGRPSGFPTRDPCLEPVYLSHVIPPRPLGINAACELLLSNRIQVYMDIGNWVTKDDNIHLPELSADLWLSLRKKGTTLQNPRWQIAPASL